MSRRALIAISAVAAVSATGVLSAALQRPAPARRVHARPAGPATSPPVRGAAVPEDREPARPLPAPPRRAPAPRPGRPAPPGDPAPAWDADAAGTGPRAAAAAYAAQFANWNARTLARQLGRLAALADLDLARAHRAAARDTALLEDARRARTGMRGRVLATAVRRATAARADVRVRVRERYFGRHAPTAATVVVYRARVMRRHRGWRVATWEPPPPARGARR
jgi:hypothetical protein